MFTLPELGFDYDALEPSIDAKTMEIHHGKHHQAYVDKLNTALEKYPEWLNKDVDDVLKNIKDLPEDVRQAVINNAGGHANHSMFWKTITPGGASEPAVKTAEIINSKFGSFEEFKKLFSDTATTRFGSGWAWLVKSGDQYGIYSTANQDSPIMEGKLPILGLDVWEHAYYLKYQNRRPDYIEAFWNIVNWDEVEKRVV